MRALSELEMRILDMVEPVAKAQGLDVVRVRVMGKGAPVLQIMAEKPDGTMDVEDCAKFSRALNPLLDEQDPIAGEYSLEVSSPGIDRPLTRPGEFGRWASHEVKVELATPIDGRKRFHGFIRSEGPEGVTIDLKDGGDVVLPVSDMVKAHLVLTDRLIKEAQSKGQAPGELEDNEEFSDLEEDFDDVEVDEDEGSDDADEDEASDRQDRE